MGWSKGKKGKIGDQVSTEPQCVEHSKQVYVETTLVVLPGQ